MNPTFNKQLAETRISDWIRAAERGRRLDGGQADAADAKAAFTVRPAARERRVPAPPSSAS
jgi:hypothetical protein